MAVSLEAASETRPATGWASDESANAPPNASPATSVDSPRYSWRNVGKNDENAWNVNPRISARSAV